MKNGDLVKEDNEEDESDKDKESHYIIRYKSSSLKDTYMKRLFNKTFTEGDIMYHITYKNGIVRFITSHLPLWKRIMLTYSESRSLLDTIMNIVHAKIYGCFCLATINSHGGVESKDEDGKVKGSTILFNRHNKWAWDSPRFEYYAILDNNHIQNDDGKQMK